MITDRPSANPDELIAVARALEAGVPVVVLGTMPARARGFADAATRDAQVASTMASIGGALRVALGSADIPLLLENAGVSPAVEIVSTDCTTVSMAHREVDNGDVFLLFHEHSFDCSASLSPRTPGARAWVLDPLTGASRAQPRADVVDVSLGSRRPLVLFVER